MQQSVRYVTSQNMWSIQYGKPLTDRRINQLRREGHYASPYAALKAVETKRKKRKAAVENFLNAF